METKAFVNWQAVQKILDKETTQGLSATLYVKIKLILGLRQLGFRLGGR